MWYKEKNKTAKKKMRRKRVIWLIIHGKGKLLYTLETSFAQTRVNYLKIKLSITITGKMSREYKIAVPSNPTLSLFKISIEPIKTKISQGNK